MKKLYVGNLPFQATEEDISNLVKQAGATVATVSLVTDRETGQPRGFAFVEMAKDEEAAKAINDLNGKDVAGRALRVNEATPKPERNTRGGGGFGDGGGRGGGSRNRGGFSTEDYRGAARQPKEPRW